MKKDLRKTEEMYKDEETDIYVHPKEKYILVYDKAINLKIIKDILNKCRRYFKFNKKDFQIYIFMDDETMQYHSGCLMSGRCFPFNKEFTIITIRIGIPLKIKNRKRNRWNRMVLFQTLWNELWHATGEKGPRFPPKKVMKEIFKR